MVSLCELHTNYGIVLFFALTYEKKLSFYDVHIDTQSVRTHGRTHEQCVWRTPVYESNSTHVMYEHNRQSAMMKRHSSIHESTTQHCRCVCRCLILLLLFERSGPMLSIYSEKTRTKLCTHPGLRSIWSYLKTARSVCCIMQKLMAVCSQFII